MDSFFNIGLYHFLITAFILFSIGLLGIIISKNLIKMLISVAIMFCGVSLNLAAFTVYCDNLHFKGFVLALFIMIFTVLYLIIGIAIIYNIYKLKNSQNADSIRELKG